MSSDNNGSESHKESTVVAVDGVEVDEDEFSEEDADPTQSTELAQAPGIDCVLCLISAHCMCCANSCMLFINSHVCALIWRGLVTVSTQRPTLRMMKKRKR